MIDITMRASRNVMAHSICGLLRDFYDRLDAGTYGDRVRDVFGVFDQTAMVYTTRPIPNYFFAGRDGFIYLGIQGAGKLPVAALLHQGYIQGYSSRNNTGIHNPGAIMGQEIVNEIIPLIRAKPTRIIIGGHSFGGVVALAAAFRLRSMWPQADISVCSFGSPKPGDYRTREFWRGIDVCRWMGDDDACSFVPFSAAQGPVMWALLDEGPRRNSLAFRQPTSGIVLRADGTYYWQELPDESPAIQEAGMVSWILGADNNARRSHLLQTYLVRLGNMADDLAAPGIPVGVEVRPPGEVALAGAAFRVPNNEPVPIVPLPILTAPRPGPPGASTNPYYSGLENRNPVVRYADLTIAVCKTRRQARDLARTLNTAYRRWNRTRVGDQQALEQSVLELFLP